MNLIWLLRMRRMASQRRPMWQIKMLAGIVVICIFLMGIEKFIGWPEVLTLQNMRGHRVIP
jgi:hypothetical protein